MASLANKRRYLEADIFNFCFDENTNILKTGLVQTQYANITTQTSILVKTGPGILGNLTLNKPIANGVIAIYDGLNASGALMGTITMPSTLLNHPAPFQYDVIFQIGLFIVTSVAAQDMTITFN